jgi:hypothetical protein
MKAKITKAGIRRIQDTIQQSMTKREQERMGDGYFALIAQVIASTLETDREAMEIL